MITNLHPEVLSEDLQDVFSQVGRVKKAEVHMDEAGKSKARHFARVRRMQHGRAAADAAACGRALQRLCLLVGPMRRRPSRC